MPDSSKFHRKASPDVKTNQKAYGSRTRIAATPVPHWADLLSLMEHSICIKLDLSQTNYPRFLAHSKWPW